MSARHSFHPPLLQCAAQLEVFDASVLQLLCPEAADGITPLLHSALTTQTLAGSWRIVPVEQERIIRSLSLEQHCAAHQLLEHAWQQAFALLVAAAEPAPALEERCFVYLRRLADLYLARRDQPAFRQILAQAEQHPPRLLAHQQLLTAYTLNRDARTGSDRQTLVAPITLLLEQPELDPHARVRLLNTLGFIHFFQAQYEAALAAYRQIEPFASIAPDYLAISLLNRSMIHNQLGRPGDLEQALALLKRALVASSAAVDVYREAHISYELGHNLMLLGRWQEARQHLERADQFYRCADVAADHPQVLWCQGFLHQLIGDVAASESAYRQVLKRTPDADASSVRLDASAFLALLLQTQQRYTEARTLYEAVLRHPMARETDYAHELALILYRYSDLLLHMDERPAARAALVRAIEILEQLRAVQASEHFKLGILGSAQQVYEALVTLLLEDNDLHTALEYIERARSRAFLDLLDEKEQLALSHEPDISLSAIQARLGPQTGLIEFFTTGVLVHNQTLLEHIPAHNTVLRDWLQPPPKLFILAISATETLAVRSQLDMTILRPPSAAVNQNRLLQDALLVYLYQQLLAPVQPLLEHKTLLYLIPHGPLHHVPFMALRPSRQQYLLHAHGPALAIVPSATVLFRTAINRPPSPNHAFISIGHNGPEDDRLQWAEAEAELLAHSFAGEAFVDGQARPALLERSQQARFLHIASHCRYDPLHPLSSALDLGSLVRAQDILDQLRLDAAIVSLSGCMSGVSHVVPGDEQLGLQRAVLYAGARTVLCTQWRTHDLVAPLVMMRFYHAIMDGAGAGAALQQAVVWVRSLIWTELEQVLEDWATQIPLFAEGLRQLRQDAPRPDAAPFEHPAMWATFIIVGQAEA